MIHAVQRFYALRVNRCSVCELVPLLLALAIMDSFYHFHFLINCIDNRYEAVSEFKENILVSHQMIFDSFQEICVLCLVPRSCHISALVSHD